MAMNKLEKLEMENLRTARDLARSLRWPEYARPAHMTTGEIKQNRNHKITRWNNDYMVARGWFMNSHSMYVSYGASDGHSHNRDGEIPDSQNGGVMWRCKADALRAMRLEVTERVARELAKIDAQILEADLSIEDLHATDAPSMALLREGGK